MLVINTSDIIGRTFLMLPQEYGQKFQVSIVKIIDDHEKSYHKTLVTTSSYVLLMMINNKRLFHTTTLSITFQINRMKISCGNSDA